jgi:hypothetical protein
LAAALLPVDHSCLCDAELMQIMQLAGSEAALRDCILQFLQDHIGFETVDLLGCGVYDKIYLKKR